MPSRDSFILLGDLFRYQKKCLVWHASRIKYRTQECDVWVWAVNGRWKQGKQAIKCRSFWSTKQWAAVEEVDGYDPEGYEGTSSPFCFVACIVCCELENPCGWVVLWTDSSSSSRFVFYQKTSSVSSLSSFLDKRQIVSTKNNLRTWLNLVRFVGDNCDKSKTQRCHYLSVFTDPSAWVWRLGSWSPRSPSNVNSTTGYHISTRLTKVPRVKCFSHPEGQRCLMRGEMTPFLMLMNGWFPVGITFCCIAYLAAMDKGWGVHFLHHSCVSGCLLSQHSAGHKLLRWHMLHVPRNNNV